MFYSPEKKEQKEEEKNYNHGKHGKAVSFIEIHTFHGYSAETELKTAATRLGGMKRKRSGIRK
jgi:hypothetical protein